MAERQPSDTTPQFGDLLRAALGGRPITELVRALDVHRSVVSRWLSNARVPKLNSVYLDQIKTALGLTDDAVKRLREAQIAALSKEPTARSKRSRRGEQTAVTHFIERANRRDGARQPPPRPLSQRPASPSRPATSPRGRLNVLRDAITLLERAAAYAGPRTGPILLSVQGKGLFEGLPDADGWQRAWQEALRRALECGWEVEELWRLDSNIGRSLQLVEGMLDLIGTGNYHPLYFKRYGLLTPPYDLIVVPGVGALLLLATEERGHVDAGIPLTQPEQIALVAAHYAQLRVDTQRLLEPFLPERHEIEFTRALVAAEAKPGGRSFIMEGPSGLCMPLSWYEGDTLFIRNTRSTRAVSEEDLSEYLALLRQRRDQFDVAAQSYDFRDICTRQGIREIAESGRYPKDLQIYSTSVPVELRLEHLQNIVHTLEAHDRYQMALLDEHESEHIPTLPNRIITGLPSDGAAFINTWLPDRQGRPAQLTLHITEAMLVNAFRQHFEEAWERIAPPHKEKVEVLAWLRAQIAALERQVP